MTDLEEMNNAELMQLLREAYYTGWTDAKNVESLNPAHIKTRKSNFERWAEVEHDLL